MNDEEGQHRIQRAADLYCGHSYPSNHTITPPRDPIDSWSLLVVPSICSRRFKVARLWSIVPAANLTQSWLPTWSATDGKIVHFAAVGVLAKEAIQ